MAYCGKCGNQLQEGARFCANCGTTTAAADGALQQAGPTGYGAGQGTGQAGAQQAYRQPEPPPVQPRVYEPDGEERTLAIGARTVLSYMGLLLLVPLLVDKKSRFARYHAGQGLNLLIFGVGYAIVSAILTAIFTAISFYAGAVIGVILNIIGLWVPAFAILGVVRVCMAQMKPLPIFGHLEIIKM